jgi:hypothetical protein
MKCVGDTYLNSTSCRKEGGVCIFDEAQKEGPENVNPC